MSTSVCPPLLVVVLLHVILRVMSFQLSSEVFLLKLIFAEADSPGFQDGPLRLGRCGAAGVGASVGLGLDEMELA